MSKAIKKNWGWALLAGILTTAVTLFILNVSSSDASQKNAAGIKGDGCCTTCVCSKDGGKCCNGVTDGKCCTDPKCCCNNGTCKCAGTCCGNKTCASGMKAGAAHHGCPAGMKADGAHSCAMKNGCSMKTEGAGKKSCCKDKGAAAAGTTAQPSGQTTAPATDGTSIK